jgi:predicted nuclease of predicted toxin-antitoxin system
VKLLLDENLSFRLIRLLQSHFPETVHVRDLGFSQADDLSIWEFARLNGFTIVSKDADFHQLAFVKGAPPKVVWVQRGNCSTDQIANLMVKHHIAIQNMIKNEESTFLALR